MANYFDNWLEHEHEILHNPKAIMEWLESHPDLNSKMDKIMQAIKEKFPAKDGWFYDIGIHYDFHSGKNDCLAVYPRLLEYSEESYYDMKLETVRDNYELFRSVFEDFFWMIDYHVPGDTFKFVEDCNFRS